MMNNYEGVQFSSQIEKLFSSGTVILFTCKSTSDFSLLSVTNNAKEILGFEPAYFTEHENAWSNRIHPDDEERVFKQFRKVLDDGRSAVNEYRFKRKDGSYIWLRDEIKRIDGGTDSEEAIIYGSSIDITERKKAEIALKENKTEELKEEIERRKNAELKLQKRLAYEKVISKCSHLLLESNDSEALGHSLEMLREVTNTDLAYVYKNCERNGDLYLKQLAEVTSASISRSPKAEKRDVERKYSDVPWWYEKLSSQEIIHDSVDSIPGPASSILDRKGIKSVLVIPITIDNQWYGYVGFADMKKKRRWGENEVSILKTVAGIIAAFEKRKIIEKSLVEQRNYTETILNSLPSIYLLMNKELEFVQWNNNAERYTGYSGDELAAKNAFDLIVPEDHTKLEKATREAQDNKGLATELKLRTKSGQKVPYYWRGYYIELKGEECFLCVGVDITQQKKTEQKLLEEKRFSEALLESLPGVFYMFDEEGNYERWNQNLLDVTGYTEEEMQQIDPSAFFSEEPFDEVEKEIGKVFTDGQTDVESTLRTKDGRELPYYFTGQQFNINNEHYLIGVGHDISQQMEARKKLKKNEELFRNLFLQAPAAIAMVDPDNKITSINNSFEKLFGYTEEEIKGKDIDQILVPDNEMDEAPQMPGTNYSIDSFHKEAQRRTKGGTLVDVFVAGIPVYVDGKPIAGFGMYIDISEQKKYEEEIYTSLKEKHVLLQEIHHRVKNNLAVVSGLIQLQMYETDDDEVRDTLQESESRIQTMALIHEKLYKSENLSRISCESYIGDLVETIRSTNDTTKDISVHKQIDDVQLSVNKAVPFALLVNEIVTNAFKHAFENRKEGEIYIRLEGKGDTLEAEIRDDGVGLPENLDLQSGDSLGMKLIQNFIKQLDADGQLDSDNGTYLELSFDIGDINGSSASGLMEM